MGGGLGKLNSLVFACCNYVFRDIDLFKNSPDAPPSLILPQEDFNYKKVYRKNKIENLRKRKAEDGGGESPGGVLNHVRYFTL